jgi:hypothetical protein
MTVAMPDQRGRQVQQPTHFPPAVLNVASGRYQLTTAIAMAMVFALLVTLLDPSAA